MVFFSFDSLSQTQKSFSHLRDCARRSRNPQDNLIYRLMAFVGFFSCGFLEALVVVGYCPEYARLWSLTKAPLNAITRYLTLTIYPEYPSLTAAANLGLPR